MIFPRCDVGRATGPWGERYFFEGAGAGLLPDYLRELASLVKEQEDAESISKKKKITRHVALLRRLLPTYSAREWQLSLDGEDVSGRYLLWEAMNIRSVGPVLTLAPQAETADGQFDFVAAPESDRSLLAHHLAARLEGNAIAFPLPRGDSAICECFGKRPLCISMMNSGRGNMRSPRVPAKSKSRSKHLR